MNLSDLTGIVGDPRTGDPSDKLVDSMTRIGMEMEVENANDIIRFPPPVLWTRVGDNSLRNYGAEYVSLPVKGKDIITALDNLVAHLEPHQIQLTQRCSFHIHLDMTPLTTDDLLEYLILMCILESTLFKLVDPRRETSLYCVPFYRAEETLNILGRLLAFSKLTMTARKKSKLTYALQDIPRYHACNLASLFKHGTIELRQHEATLDKEKLLRWINIHLALRQAATENRIADGWPAWISEHGITEFVIHVFDSMAEYILPHIDDAQIYEGLRLAQVFLSSYTLEEELAHVKAIPLEECLSTKFIKSKIRSED